MFPGRDAARRPAEPSGVPYRVQVGLFETADDARRVAERVEAAVGESALVVYRAPFYRVMLGMYARRDAAEVEIERLHRLGFGDARWVYEYENE